MLIKRQARERKAVISQLRLRGFTYRSQADDELGVGFQLLVLLSNFQIYG